MAAGDVFIYGPFKADEEPSAGGTTEATVALNAAGVVVADDITVYVEKNNKYYTVIKAA